MLRIFLVFSLLISFSLPVLAKNVTVAVAANFSESMKRIIVEFNKYHPDIEVKLVIGSSGKLFAQIQQGAPFDLFLSADQFKPKQLEQLGLIEQESRQTYAKGSLILWSETLKVVDENTLKTYQGKIAIANPKLAPYGLAAKETLQHFNNPHIKTIQANNVIGALQYIQTKSVNLGLIAKSSLNHASNDTKYWEVDSDFYTPILQDMAIIKQKKVNKSARKLWAFILKQDTQKIIEYSGYSKAL